MGPDVQFAHELADAAGALTLGRFRTPGLLVETKPDLSPVTEVDLETEAALRALVAERRPGEAVAGEELGLEEAPARWIVDPIDGTRNYVRGNPVWATLLAFEREGVVEAAVISAPALGRRWWAERGGGAFTDGGGCSVSAIASLDAAVVSATSERDMPAGWAAVTRNAWTVRGFGDFWQYCLLAEGAVDAAADESLQLWDYAGIQLLVEEAGGRCSTFADGPPAPDAPFLATNGLLHADVVSRLA
jgi:histidinol-phosphatase